MRDDGLDPNMVRDRCAKIRERYYEFDIDPHDAGFSVLSAPIFNYAEKLEAALTIVMNRRQNVETGDIRFMRPLKETAIEVSRALGSVEMADAMTKTL